MKKQRLYLIALLSLAGLFLYELWGVGLACADNVSQCVTYVKQAAHPDIVGWIESQVDFAIKQGRFFWPTSVLLYLPRLLMYGFSNHILYKFVFYLALALETMALYQVLKKLAGANLSRLYVVVFLALACIDGQHNLFITYGWDYHYAFFLFWISVWFLLRHHESGKRSHKLWSGVFFFYACTTYENMTVMAIPFGIFMIFYHVMPKLGARKEQENVEKGKGFGHSIRDFIATTWQLFWPHVVLSCFYLVVELWWSKMHPSTYTGNTLTSTNTLAEILRTWWIYGSGRFPLVLDLVDLADYTKAQWLYAGLKTLFVAALFFFLLKALPRVQKRWLALGIVVGEIGAFVSVLLISLTSKYIRWTLNGTTAYLPSYYSYVFHVLAVICALWLLREMLLGSASERETVAGQATGARTDRPRTILVYACMMLCTIYFALLSFYNTLHTLTVADAYQTTANRMNMLAVIADEDHLGGLLEKGDQIYMPYYVSTTLSSYGTYSYTTTAKVSTYLSTLSGVSVTATNDEANLTFDDSHQVYIIDYDNDAKAYIWGLLQADGTISDPHVLTSDVEDIALFIRTDAGYQRYDLETDMDASLEDISLALEEYQMISLAAYAYANDTMLHGKTGDDGLSVYEISGFYRAEESYTWSVGNQGQLCFILEDYESGDISFDVAFYMAYTGMQYIEVYANGHPCFADYVTDGIYSITILDEWVEAGGHLFLDVYYPDAISPADNEGLDDTRQLAVAWLKMRLLW